MSDTGAPPPPPPPSAGAGGQLPQRGLGDILSTAFELYRTNAAKLIQIVAIVVVPLSLVQAILVEVLIDEATGRVEVDQVTGQVTVDAGGGLIQTLLGAAIVALVSVIIQQLLAGSLTRGAAGSLLGRPVDVGDSYRYAFSRIGGLIGLAILVGIVVFVGYLLLIIPGIIFSVFLAMAMPAFIVERKSVTDAMSRSWGLVSGSWWHTLGTIFVAGLLAGVVSGIIGAIGGSTLIGSWIFGAIGQIITAPFVALVAVVLYVDLRARREGLSADQLGTELDAATA
jgi:hypothetical protein